MSNSNERGLIGHAAEAHGRQDVVHVYQRLAGQNRWTGVAYDADTGSVVATASSGTRAGTRAALERASAPAVYDGSSGQFPPDRGTRGIGAARQPPGLRRSDLGGRRAAMAPMHAG